MGGRWCQGFRRTIPQLQRCTNSGLGQTWLLCGPGSSSTQSITSETRALQPLWETGDLKVKVKVKQQTQAVEHTENHLDLNVLKILYFMFDMLSSITIPNR